MERLFLGLDSSTQSLSPLVIDLDTRRIVYDGSQAFDDIPEYGTRNGVLPSGEPGVVHAPPLVWVEAVDRVFEKMKDAGVPLNRILAVSGSGQQHGSVYLKPGFNAALDRLDPDRRLAENLEDTFSRATAPIWQDSSTSAECREIGEALGGMLATAAATGSIAIERFTGPQIRKFFKQDPQAYEQTGHVALVSSFLASILAGRVADMDPGDGAGMNLMDIGRKTWLPEALEATAPSLSGKLPGISPSWSVIGNVSSYFVDRYGLAADTKCLVWSGDNPNSVVGLGLIQPGMAAISLGTSDTFIGTMADCHTDPRGEGHVFGSPAGGYMSLICLTNGSLAREKVKDQYGLDWNGFSGALADTRPGNEGRMILPWFGPETVPKVLEPEVHRKDLDPADAPANCRAVVESQMMALRLHSEWMGIRPERMYATGGASANTAILQIMADVHRSPVYRSEVTNSAGLGAALRAAHGYLEDAGTPMPWDEIVRGFADPIEASRIDPDPASADVYDEAIRTYAEFEQDALGG